MREAIARRDGRDRERASNHSRRRGSCHSRDDFPISVHTARSYTSSTNSHTKRRGQHDRKSKTPHAKYQPEAYHQQEDLKKWLNKKLAYREQHPNGYAAQDLINRVLDQIAFTLFAKEIELCQPPRKVTPLKFTPYDEKADPLGHVWHYKQIMALWSGE